MLSDKRIKKITSLQRKVILGFLKGRDCLVVREQNEAVEMRGCPGAIAFEYTHERNILIGEKITGPIIMPKTSLQI